MGKEHCLDNCPRIAELNQRIETQRSSQDFAIGQAFHYEDEDSEIDRQAKTASGNLYQMAAEQIEVLKTEKESLMEACPNGPESLASNTGGICVTICGSSALNGTVGYEQVHIDRDF